MSELVKEEDCVYSDEGFGGDVPIHIIDRYTGIIVVKNAGGEAYREELFEHHDDSFGEGVE